MKKRLNKVEATENESLNEKGLLSELAKNQKQWGIDLYQADENADLLSSMKQNQFQALEIIDYLEEYVIPFLEGYACDDEKRALKRWIFQTRGKIEKVRRGQIPGDFKSEDHFDDHTDDFSGDER